MKGKAGQCVMRCRWCGGRRQREVKPRRNVAQEKKFAREARHPKRSYCTDERRKRVAAFGVMLYFFLNEEMKWLMFE